MIVLASLRKYDENEIANHAYSDSIMMPNASI